jgi:NAD-dependent deacetylase
MLGGMSNPPDPAAVRAAAEQLRRARSALFITGAGISADSGLPTYRGVSGLYESTDPDEGLPIEAMLSGQMLRRAPEKCWKYIHQIEAACRGAQPNDAHRFIAALEERLQRVVVLTQNVDGLHRAAGSSTVIEIHGNLYALACTVCRWKETVADYAGLSTPPGCPECGRLVRPEVVLFGEMLPPYAIQSLMLQLRLGFDVVFTVGTTSVFPYIAQPVMDAARRGIPTFEVNPGDSEVSEVVDWRLRAGAAATFNAIAAAL